MLRGFLLCLTAAVGACIGTGAWKLLPGVILSNRQSAAVVRPIKPKETPQERYQAMLAWNRRTLKGAYDKVGAKDPRWNAQAHETLDAMARFLTDSQDQPVTQAELHDMATKLAATGCHDPLILYVLARSQPRIKTKWSATEIGNFRTAAMAMHRSAYPPLRRIAALKHAANALLEARTISSIDKAEARLWFVWALEILPQSVAEDERIHDVHHQQFDLALDALHAFKEIDRTDLATAYQCVDSILAKHPAVEVIRLKLRGQFFINHAWEARGTGLASSVTDDGWQKMHARLREARSALERAWELNPGDCLVPSLMITIGLGQQSGRAEMEEWYRRGVETYTVDDALCQAKLLWLSTRWYGEPGERIAFAKSLRDPNLWRGTPPTYVSVSHYDTAELEFMGKDLRPYFRRADVMDDIRQEFDDHLARSPHDLFARCEYAYFCYLAGDYPCAHEQFQRVGNRLMPGRRWTEAMVRHAQAIVAQRMRQPAEAARLQVK